MSESPVPLVATAALAGSVDNTNNNGCDREGDWRAQLQTRLLPLNELTIEPTRIAQAAVLLILHAAPVANDADAQPEKMAQLSQTPPLPLQALVIKRAEHPRDPWSGHLALPGGRAEAHDADLAATAIREVREELGWALEAKSCLIGRLPKLAPRNPQLPRLEITPLVALVTEVPPLQPNHEVAAAFWTALAHLKANGMNAQYQLTLPTGETRAWPAYPSAHGPIWASPDASCPIFWRAGER